MSNFSPIPPPLRVEETCDYCRRAFVRARGLAAICPSCGLENKRVDVDHQHPRPIESGMLSPAAEKAVLSMPQPKPRPRRHK